MAHHAYFYAGPRGEGLSATRHYALAALNLPLEGHPDVALFSYGLFSVDDARRIGSFAIQAPVLGQHKLVVITAERLFHEAQNALLKLFEEPPAGTHLVLIVPSEGLLLPTLRSRLLTLPEAARDPEALTPEAKEFLDAAPKERETLVEKLLDRAKSDKDEVKQAARGEAVRLVEGLLFAAHQKWRTNQSRDLALLLEDLTRFLPLLHERSAPLKQIFEHILITLPKSL